MAARRDNMEHLNAFTKETIWADLAKLYETATHGMYTIDDTGNTCELKTYRNGKTRKIPLADFVIIPSKIVVHNNGRNRFVEYWLTGYDCNRCVLPLVSIPASKVFSFRWVVNSWRGAIIYSVCGAREKLRVAIQMVAREIATVEGDI